jgi:hypothetical protein
LCFWCLWIDAQFVNDSVNPELPVCVSVFSLARAQPRTFQLCHILGVSMDAVDLLNAIKTRHEAIKMYSARIRKKKRVT